MEAVASLTLKAVDSFEVEAFLVQQIVYFQPSSKKLIKLIRTRATLPLLKFTIPTLPPQKIFFV